MYIYIYIHSCIYVYYIIYVPIYTTNEVYTIIFIAIMTTIILVSFVIRYYTYEGTQLYWYNILRQRQREEER